MKTTTLSDSSMSTSHSNVEPETVEDKRLLMQSNLHAWSSIDVNDKWYSFNWDWDGKNDTVVFKNVSIDYLGAYCFYSFRDVQFKFGNRKDISLIEFLYTNGINTISFQDARAHIDNGLLEKSCYSNSFMGIFVLNLQRNSIVPSLFFFGKIYEDSSPLLVVGLDEYMYMKIQFYADKFFLHDLVDIDHDGIKEIVGRHYNGFYAYGSSSYSPYLAYKSFKGSYILDTALSKEYNLKNYAGWMGPNYSDKFFVVGFPCADSGKILSNEMIIKRYGSKMDSLLNLIKDPKEDCN